MLSKSVVSGAGRNALYAALDAATGKAPKWNFHKYLIDRNGKVVSSFSSNVEPDSRDVIAAIEKSL